MLVGRVIIMALLLLILVVGMAEEMFQTILVQP